MTVLPKKLAIFLPSLGGGGAERVMLRIAEGILARGYSVDLVLAQAEGPFLAEVPPSARLIDLKASRVMSSLPSLVRYLRNEKPDALLSGIHANVVALWARFLAGGQTRAVISIHSIHPSDKYQAQYATELRVRLEPRLMKLFHRWAYGIIAVSTGVADNLSRMTGIPRHFIQVIYNPIITPEVRVKSKLPLEHPWFNLGEPPVILAAGALRALKDFTTLIKAFALVRETRKARLMILGEGKERTSIEALVKRLGLEHDVSLPGFIVNPYPYMVRAPVFVLSSKFEGLPTVLVEALFCGAIIVSTDCPSGPREILHAGQYGQLVPVGDSVKMARAIENGLAGKIPRPPEGCWKPFELDTVMDQYIHVLFGSQPLS
jgi:glycosyltransferase involved in cell wall biosynthesis